MCRQVCSRHGTGSTGQERGAAMGHLGSANCGTSQYWHVPAVADLGIDGPGNVLIRSLPPGRLFVVSTREKLD